MFKNTFQSGFLSILYSIGSKPLQIWDKKVRNGHIKRITDPDIQSFVLEIVGTNVSTTYITCPADPRKTLGIKLPYLVMIVKNMKKYFTFEVQVKLESYHSWQPWKIAIWKCTVHKNSFSLPIVGFFFRFWMIRMSGEDSEPQTIKVLPESNHLSVQCQCVWMMAGTKFNSIWRISLVELMEQTMW